MRRLQESGKFKLKIWAYCLMSNHVHFVAVPSTTDSMSKTFSPVNMLYSGYFNKKNERIGHLWQDRYFSCVPDETHLVAAVRYVENNPVRAGLFSKAEDYLWSSAASHVQGGSDDLLSDDLPLLEMITDWREYLYLDRDKQVPENIRNCTKSGRPAGSDSFTKILEDILDMRIKPKPVGRPKRKDKN